MLKDIDDAVDRAVKAGVKIIITQGVNVSNNRIVLKLGEKYPKVKVALGMYPIEVLDMTSEEIDNEINFIRKNKGKIIAIGEVGMDFKEDKSKSQVQYDIFGKMIDLSIELDKTIIVHSRKAEEECIELLEKRNAKKVIMHCFSGNIKLVNKVINNKWFLSIPTCVKHSEQFQKVVEITPIEQLLCETDSPYLHPDKEFPNEPKNIIESYKKISEIKGMELEEVEIQIEKNFKRLFG